MRIISKKINQDDRDFFHELALIVDTIGDLINRHFDSQEDREFALNGFRCLARLKQLDIDLTDADGLKKSFEDFKKSHPEWVKETEQNSK